MAEHLNATSISNAQPNKLYLSFKFELLSFCSILILVNLLVRPALGKGRIKRNKLTPLLE